MNFGMKLGEHRVGNTIAELVEIVRGNVTCNKSYTGLAWSKRERNIETYRRIIDFRASVHELHQGCIVIVAHTAGLDRLWRKRRHVSRYNIAHRGKVDHADSAKNRIVDGV